MASTCWSGAAIMTAQARRLGNQPHPANFKEYAMEIGIDSFAAILPDPATGRLPSPTDRMAELIEEVEVADRVGLDVFGIGEHHRGEFLDSAPAIILAAAAARTSRIRLTSAVTVLSAADPVRVFQEFATLDLISRGARKSLSVEDPSLRLIRCSGWIRETMTASSRKSSIFCLRWGRRPMSPGRGVSARRSTDKAFFRALTNRSCRYGSASVARRNLSRGPALSAFR